jgi:hypothetical protein
MTEPVRITHNEQATAAMHILLVVAMHRLGVLAMEVTDEEYATATEDTEDLRIMFDGTHYRAIRQ